MVRLLAIVLISLLAGLAAMLVARGMRSADIDWGGWAFAAGFVALAFYLRHVTDLG